MSTENVLVALSIMPFITFHSILLFVTFLSYVSCSVSYTFESLIGYWSYLVNWHTINNGPQRAQSLTEEEEELQPLTEEEALAVYDMFNEDEGATILFLGSTLFLISSFHAMSPFLGSLSFAYHHYLLIMGPLTFTIRTL